MMQMNIAFSLKRDAVCARLHAGLRRRPLIRYHQMNIFDKGLRQLSNCPWPNGKLRAKLTVHQIQMQQRLV